MIVRDAEETLERCIKSCLPLVDRAVIIDTGSTDKTMEVAKAALGDLPVSFFESEWVGHAHNRSELLERARESGADYTLMPDADMELLQEGPLRDLEKDEYMVPIKDRGLVYPLPLLVSNSKRFYYAGVAHAYLACHDQPSEGEVLEEIAFWDHGGGGHREGKIERDRDLLAAEVGKNPMDARSWFYLAQSFRDLDQVNEAIFAYKVRSNLGGWSEEVYQALYQAGMLLSAHVNFYEGAKFLIAAAEMKQNRAEALRALAGCANAVADKIPQPKDEMLFVEPGAYTYKPPEPKIGADEVSAVIVTRGDVDLAPVLEALPYEDIVVWDNSVRDDLKIYGRYEALKECKHDIIFTVDDDVIFTNHDALLAAYKPGMITANMDPSWAAVYDRETALIGAGALWDKNLPALAFEKYLAEHPFDEDFRIVCDVVFGSLTPFQIVDLGYEVRPFADDPDRLYHQPGQTERKFEFIRRAKALA